MKRSLNWVKFGSQISLKKLKIRPHTEGFRKGARQRPARDWQALGYSILLLFSILAAAGLFWNKTPLNLVNTGLNLTFAVLKIDIDG
jgi:hypothetical protein